MRAIFFISLFSLGQLAFGQDFLSWKFNDRYFSLSAGVGAVTYFGELNSSFKINGRIKLSSLALEVRLFNRIAARIEGTYYAMEGSDRQAANGSFEQQRNLSFSSKNSEGNIQLLYYLKPYKGNYYNRWKWDSYVGTGVGITSYNPYAELQGKKYFLRNIPTEPNKKYGNATLVIPVIAGIKFRVNKFTNLNLEIGYRFTTTDYLDDVSTRFPESNEIFLIDQLANRRDDISLVNADAYDLLIPGAKRGDPSKNDSYLFINFKVELFLPKDLLSRGKGGLKKSSIKW